MTKDLQDIIDLGDKVDAERRAAFDRDMTPDEIRAYGIKNRLPKAVIYKMLEKYHYLALPAISNSKANLLSSKDVKRY